MKIGGGCGVYRPFPPGFHLPSITANSQLEEQPTAWRPSAIFGASSSTTSIKCFQSKVLHHMLDTTQNHLETLSPLEHNRHFLLCVSLLSYHRIFDVRPGVFSIGQFDRVSLRRQPIIVTYHPPFRLEYIPFTPTEE